jgi:hypothetical protein
MKTYEQQVQHDLATGNYDPDEVGTCDICECLYILGSDDHNPDTGNHYECENH